MVLQLHVWGPAFGLASIDAECLAAIAYMAYAVPKPEWELVATSPSAVPAHALPALHDTTSGAWTSGYTPIAARLSRLNPAWDLDAGLPPPQRADTTAYTAFLAGAAAPLLALSLYVSSANWAAATRPAYTAVLPFPLTWTEPPAARRRMCRAAEHLGLSDLNIDDAADNNPAADTDTRGFLKVPERLRPAPRGVKAALAPEQTALFRLEAAAHECLGVLEGAFIFGGGGRRRPAALDCLAFGYLSLMLVPDVPRPWLRGVLRARYEPLCVFVDGLRDELFGGDVAAAAAAAAASLPWRAGAAGGDEQPWTVTRFARGIVEAAVPEDWLLGGAYEQAAGPGGAAVEEGHRSRAAVLSALGSAAVAVAVVGGGLLYRHLSPFGSAVYRWETQRRTFGAAGAFFGI